MLLDNLSRHLLLSFFLSVLIIQVASVEELQGQANSTVNSLHQESKEATKKQDAISSPSDVWSMVASMGSNNGQPREEYKEWLDSGLPRFEYESENRDEDFEFSKANPEESPLNDDQKSNWQHRRKEYDWDLDLDESGHFKLFWRTREHANKITFSLHLNTNQFKVGSDVFALGFSERGETKSSDFCVIWYDLSHRLHMQDAQTNADNILLLSESPKKVCKLKRVIEDQALEQKEEEEETQETDNRDEFNRNNAGLRLDSYERHRQDRELKIVFTRPLDVCQTPEATKKFYTIDDGTTHLVWFKLNGPIVALDGLNLSETILARPTMINSVDHLTESKASSNKGHSSLHSNFGLRRVQLLAAKVPKERAGLKRDQQQRLDIRVEKFEIPQQETKYLCKLFKLPRKFEQRRYHITSYEAVIEPKQNEHVVHHMELFNCANLSPEQARDLEELYERRGGWSGDCADSAKRPEVTRTCKRVILAWAMGARPLVYPAQVGQSIGGQDYSPYVVLEIHYNNMDKQAGLLDSSGLRFHFSSKLRPFDAGVLEVGLEYTDKNSIPAKMLAPLAGHCVSECTRAAMVASSSSKTFSFAKNQHNNKDRNKIRYDNNERHHHEKRPDTQEEGIYIFAAQMHTHLTGVASWTEHVRGGRLLGELQRDDHYSPHFQEIRLLAEPIHLLPGDALIHYCLYDTRLRSNITLGGFATNEEMCVTYLHYFPRIDLEVCKSSVDTRALEQYFARLSSEEAQLTSSKLVENLSPNEMNASSKAKTVAENYYSIEWSPKRSRELLEFYSRAPLSVQCNRSNGERWPGDWNGHEATKMFWLDRAGAETAEINASGSIDAQEWRRHPAGLDFLDSLAAGADGAGASGQLSRSVTEYRGLGYGRRHAQCARRGQLAASLAI